MRDIKKTTYLGVSLGSRTVGFAVIDEGTLLDYRVVNLRNYPGVTLKEEAFLNALHRMLKTHRPGNLAFCKSPTGLVKPLVAIELHALEDLARRRNLPRQVYRTEDLRHRLLPDLTRPMNKDLAFALMKQFNLTDEHIAQAFENPERKVPSDRERYWTRMFLALGAAELLRRVDLDILRRAALNPHPYAKPLHDHP